MDNFIQSKKTARLAGFLYLVVVLTGIFSIAYVPSQLFVYDDPSLTLKNIATSELLFRSGIASGFVCYVTFLLLCLLDIQILS